MCFCGLCVVCVFVVYEMHASYDVADYLLLKIANSWLSLMLIYIITKDMTRHPSFSKALRETLLCSTEEIT
jgi:hypothetical protein